ncbi:MAG TPA: MucB/RseB C-terminal domain-containing protein [Pseudomonadales bacterium]|nr:MucB/RseB C-terminal domain-containing protein [Pseudomonadales bacterium]
MASAARAADDPSAWLERMSRALLEADYRGEFSYYRGGDLSSLRIVHAVVDGVQRERLVHLNGHPREIIRTGDVVTCILQPGDELLEFGDTIPSGPFARSFSRGVDALPEGYSARFAHEGRIAGRDARLLELAPSDATRYGYRLWLDEATGMLLRSELVDMNGEALEIFQFVSIDLDGPVDAADLEPESSGEQIWHRLAFAEAPAAGDADEAVAWEARWLPVGFAMTAADVRRVAVGDRALRTLRYTDGLASLSVFVERTWAEATWEESRQRGATSAVMRELVLPGDERFLVTVVGEVPMATAERIARSVQPRS